MKANILVVDDEEPIRSSLEQILKLEGYGVTAVGNGELAIQAFGEQAFDLMLLDLKMPGMDGIEVLRAALKATPDTRIILLTAHGSLESAIDALRLGAHDYILKPATSSEILSSVARGLARRVEQQRRRMLIEQIDTSIKRLKDVEGGEYGGVADQQSVTLQEGVIVDLARREIWRGNQRVSLTPTEGKLIKVFLENRGRVLSHQELVMLVQGYETSEWEAPEVLRPLISRLRRKLSEFPHGEHWISNVRGTGYVFDWQEDMGASN